MTVKKKLLSTRADVKVENQAATSIHFGTCRFSKSEERESQTFHRWSFDFNKILNAGRLTLLDVTYFRDSFLWYLPYKCLLCVRLLAICVCVMCAYLLCAFSLSMPFSFDHWCWFWCRLSNQVVHCIEFVNRMIDLNSFSTHGILGKKIFNSV